MINVITLARLGACNGGVLNANVDGKGVIIVAAMHSTRRTRVQNALLNCQAVSKSFRKGLGRLVEEYP